MNINIGVSSLLSRALLLSCVGDVAAGVNRQLLSQKSQETLDHWKTTGFENAQPLELLEPPPRNERDVLDGGDGDRALLRRGGKGVPSRNLAAIVQDGHWDDTNSTVMHAAGRLFVNMNGESHYCSATVVDDGNTTGRSIAITAAHCVYPRDYEDSPRIFASNVVFVPMQDDGGTDGTNVDINPDCDDDPYGCWVADFVVVQDEWVDKSWPDNAFHNWAFIVFSDVGSHLHNDTVHSGVPEALDQAVSPMPVDFSGINDCGGNHEGVLMGYSGGDQDPHFRYCYVTAIHESPEWGYEFPGCGLREEASGGPGMLGCNLGEGPITTVVSWGRDLESDSPEMGGPILSQTLAECGFELAKSVVPYHVAGSGNGIVIESDGSGSGCQVREGYLKDVLFLEDDFEGTWGHWNDGGQDVKRVGSRRWTERPNYATYVQPIMGNVVVQLRDDSGVASSLTSDLIDANSTKLAGFTGITVEFDFAVERFENTESFFVEICQGVDPYAPCLSTPGMTQSVEFINGQHFTSNGNNQTEYLMFYPHLQVDFDMPSSEFVIRFRCHASGNADRLFIGGIRVYAVY